MRHFNENWDGIVRKNNGINGIMSFQERNRFVQTMQSAAWLDESIHFTTEEILIFKEGNFEKLSKMLPLNKIIEAVKRTALWAVTKIDTLSGIPKILVHACRDYSSGKINFGKFKSILVSQCNIPSSVLNYMKPKFEKMVANANLRMEAPQKESTLGTMAMWVMSLGITGGLLTAFGWGLQQYTQMRDASKSLKMLQQPAVVQAVEKATNSATSSPAIFLAVLFATLIGVAAALWIYTQDNS